MDDFKVNGGKNDNEILKKRHRTLGLRTRADTTTLPVG